LVVNPGCATEESANGGGWSYCTPANNPIDSHNDDTFMKKSVQEWTNEEGVSQEKITIQKTNIIKYNNDVRSQSSHAYNPEEFSETDPSEECGHGKTCTGIYRCCGTTCWAFGGMGHCDPSCDTDEQCWPWDSEFMCVDGYCKFQECTSDNDPVCHDGYYCSAMYRCLPDSFKHAQEASMLQSAAVALNSRVVVLFFALVGVVALFFHGVKRARKFVHGTHDTLPTEDDV